MCQGVETAARGAFFSDSQRPRAQAKASEQFADHGVAKLKVEV
jgi:hypothetical protein